MLDTNDILPNQPFSIDEVSELFHIDDKIVSEIPSFNPKIINKEITLDELGYILKLDRLSYCQLVFHVNAMLHDALKDIQQFEIKEFKLLRGEEKDKYITDLITLYRKTILSPKPEVISFFKKVGFSDDNLRWFIPLNTVIKEINKIIERNKIVLLPGSALGGIAGYLQYGATNEVFMWAGEYSLNYDGIKYSNTFFKKGKNYLRYNADFSNLNFFEVDIPLEGLKRLFDNVNYKKMALAFLKGDTSKIHLQYFISISHFLSNVESQNKFFAEFFELIRLVMGKPSTYISYHYLQSREEYIEHSPSYETYMGKRIKELFWKKNSLRVKIPPEYRW